MMGPVPTRSRRLVGAVVVVVVGVLLLAVVVGVAGWWTLAYGHQAKDRRDLIDLTRSLPWDRTTLRVPDAVAAEDDASAWAHSGGFGVSYRRGPGSGRGAPMIEYAVHRVDDGATPPEVVSCEATAIVTCTDVGDSLREVLVHDTDNSDPALALYQDSDGRLITVRGYDGPVDLRDLREVLRHTHAPTDAELLGLLRPPGYQTDWS